jgi:NADH-quinone oxidoreductase subunit M
VDCLVSAILRRHGIGSGTCRCRARYRRGFDRAWSAMSYESMTMPWLSGLLGLTAAAALTVSRLGGGDRARAQAALVAGTMTVVSLVGAAWFYVQGTPTLWVDPLRIAWYSQQPVFALDSLNAPLFPFIAFVTLIVLLGSPRSQITPARAAGALMQLCATWMLFASLDLGFVVIAWTLGVLSVLSFKGRIAGVWRQIPWVYMLTSTVLFAMAVILIIVGGWRLGLASPTSLLELEASGSSTMVAPWLLMMLAVVMRKGIFPFQSWIPALAERDGCTPLILLVTPQVAAFVIIKVAVVMPLAMLDEALPIVGGVALVAAVYGALVGLAAYDLRRAFGWLVVSQSAFVVVGLACSNASGWTGALVMWISVGLALTGLGLAIAAVESRIGRIDLRRFYGLGARAPLLGVCVLVLGLAAVGLPGSLGFIAEDFILHGTLETNPWMGAAIVLATAANWFNVIRWYMRVFHGPKARHAYVADLLTRERLALIALMFVLVGFGLFPHHLIATRAQVVEQWVRQPRAIDTMNVAR